jgi:hypothetical protein
MVSCSRSNKSPGTRSVQFSRLSRRLARAGADVARSLWAVQCKCYDPNSIGPGHIRELLGLRSRKLAGAPVDEMQISRFDNIRGCCKSGDGVPRLIPALALSCGVLLPLGVSPARADGRCIVADPTGTPLNVRTVPNGRIVGTLPNGLAVRIRETTSLQDKAWVRVSRGNEVATIGWVVRGYLNCDGTSGPDQPTSPPPGPRPPGDTPEACRKFPQLCN